MYTVIFDMICVCNNYILYVCTQRCCAQLIGQWRLHDRDAEQSLLDAADAERPWDMTFVFSTRETNSWRYVDFLLWRTRSTIQHAISLQDSLWAVLAELSTAGVCKWCICPNGGRLSSFRGQSPVGKGLWIEGGVADGGRKCARWRDGSFRSLTRSNG